MPTKKPLRTTDKRRAKKPPPPSDIKQPKKVKMKDLPGMKGVHDPSMIRPDGPVWGPGPLFNDRRKK